MASGNDKVLAALQENLLVLAAFDEANAPIIRNVVDPALFSNVYRIVVTRIFDYIDKFKKPPADHLADILSDKLEAQSSEARLYLSILESIYATKESVNAEYIMGQLETFVKRQSLRGIAIDLAKALQRDTEDSLQEAEALIAGAGRVQLSVFDAGTRLSNKSRTLEFLNLADAAYPTGVRELDRRGFGPTRKELWLMVANTSAGKSWALIQLGKVALMHHLRVCHLSLEMSEERCAQRYLQSIFAISKRRDRFRVTKFQRDQLGRIAGFDDVQVAPKISFEDQSIRKRLERKIDRYSSRLLDNIIIKQFPTGQLTVRQLEGYLDNLENAERFIPDLLIVDYPDLMRLDRDNYRISLDEIYKQLRGVAVARNIAIAIVSQSHRGAAKAKQVGAENVAEAYSKIAHCDTVITFSQTEPERQLGLARLYVAKGRNDADKVTICISQLYDTGQFVVDSVLMDSGYWQHVPKEGEDV